MEAPKIKMNMDGTFRVKVLQYKSDGNTLTEKWHTLSKFAEGIYLSYAAPDRYGQVYTTVVFAKNGVFWKAGCEPEQCFNPDSSHYAEHVEILKRKYADYEANIMQAVTNGGWLNKLHITVMGRLGHDTTAMIEAYNEVRRQREERDRQQAEEAERRERERREVEDRRKAEALADGKKKLMNHECITVEQIELIAEAVDYKIHIRTIGFIREKVTEVVLREDDTVTVWGRKLTSRNIDGTANVLRELYNRLKAQAEEETTEPVKHISEVLKEAEQNYQCVKSETLHTVRETDGKWHTYFMGDEIGIDLAYDQINHIPATLTAQAAEEVAEILRYMNRLTGNHIADADYYLAEMREGIKQAEAAQRKKNADAEGENKAERAENNESAELLAAIKRHEWGAAPILFAYDPDKHIASATFKSSSGGISVVNAKCDIDGYCHVYDSCMTIEELGWENIHTHNVIEPP